MLNAPRPWTVVSYDVKDNPAPSIFGGLGAILGFYDTEAEAEAALEELVRCGQARDLLEIHGED